MSLERLKECLGQEDVVLFVGSGVSRWSGLPSWHELIDELSAYVASVGGDSTLIKSEAKTGSLLQAASYGFSQLNSYQTGEFIRKATRYGIAKPALIHQQLVSLGARCFITTNYDNLLEESLRAWQPERFYPAPITNRTLTEIGGILHAKALDFIFKPHGDAGDAESIILTREQYRHLMPQGERHYAMEALKTLMVSRPIVYIGFSLRDPDFTYLQDLLGNTFKGAVRDHFALLPDVTPSETNYWRVNYGINIVSYETQLSEDGFRDHSALSKLLNELACRKDKQTGPATFDPKSADVQLALARHAAKLSRAPKAHNELQLRVSNVISREQPLKFSSLHFENSCVEELLDSVTSCALIGPPGAGKSYAIAQAAARIAADLHNRCMNDNEDGLVIPILIDLKLYRGNLSDLISSTLPPLLSLDKIKEHFPIKIFIDSFNEMPKEYFDDVSYEADFSELIDSLPGATIIAGSRTTDGLDKFNLRHYSLDSIDSSAVEQVIAKHNPLSTRFEKDLRNLLSKPYFFRLVADSIIELPTDPHPKDVYNSLLSNLEERFTIKFGELISLSSELREVAYKSIDSGQEAFPLTNLVDALNEKINGTQANFDGRDIANWLVSQDILIPYSGARIAFAHQSLTEFLAACELAQRFMSDPGVLKEQLKSTRWDQTLFLSISILPPAQGDIFYQHLVDTDLCLAMSAVKYLETDRSSMVSKLLQSISSRAREFDHASRVPWLLREELPVEKSHENELREIIQAKDFIGGAAAARVINLIGEPCKDEFVELMADNMDDYNFCANGISKELSNFATLEDIKKILEIANRISESSSEEDSYQGLATGAANFLSKLEIKDVAETFLHAGQALSVVAAEILLEALWDKHTTQAMNIASSLLLREVKGAATSIYFIGRFAGNSDAISWKAFNHDHIERLIPLIRDRIEDDWALSALELICKNRNDLAQIVLEKGNELGGLEQLTLRAASGMLRNDEILAEAEAKFLEIQNSPETFTYLLSQIDLEWSERKDLFLALLRVRHPRLAEKLIDQLRGDEPLGLPNVGPINWWLDWLSAESDHMFRSRFSVLFSEHVTTEVRRELIAEFNKDSSIFRRVLANHVLNGFHDLKMEDLSSSALVFLLKELENVHIDYRGSVLGNCATEQFVNDKLLPLLKTENALLMQNVRKVLHHTGQRHGRRYVAEA